CAFVVHFHRVQGFGLCACSDDQMLNLHTI
ncbi:MAG: hypothetical protein RLZZ612_1303, partial [Pseudomonadota bacterium]